MSHTSFSMHAFLVVTTSRASKLLAAAVKRQVSHSMPDCPLFGRSHPLLFRMHYGSALKPCARLSGQGAFAVMREEVAVMMCPYMTFEDGTEVVHLQLIEGGETPKARYRVFFWSNEAGVDSRSHCKGSVDPKRDEALAYASGRLHRSA